MATLPGQVEIDFLIYIASLCPGPLAKRHTVTTTTTKKKSDRSKPGTKPYIISVDAYLAPKDATENSSPEKRSTAAAGRHSYLTDLCPAIHGVGPDPEKKGLNVFCQKQNTKSKAAKQIVPPTL